MSGIQSRHDPRVEPDDLPDSDDTGEPTGPGPLGAKPQSAKRVSRAPAAALSSDAHADRAAALDGSGFVELPAEVGSARHRSASVPPPTQRRSIAGSRSSFETSAGGRSHDSFEGSARTLSASSPNVVTSLDPRFEQIEPIIDEGNWHTVSKHLGSLEETGRLPPTLGLVAAVAHSEIAGEAGCPEANDLAIRCMAGVFGLPVESALSRVLAKRLLRRNQRVAPKRPTMPASLAFVLIAIFLAGGLVGGYLIGSGTLKVSF